MSGLTACETCGTSIAESAKMCPNCGASSESGKNALVALILCFFLAFLGAHNWYLGRPLRAIGQMIFAGVNLLIGWVPIVGWGLVGILFLWVAYDFISILLGWTKDGDGRTVSL